MTPPPPRSLCAAPPGAHDDTACSLGYTLPAPALRVWTARISYQGADRLDITRAGADAARRKSEPFPGEPWAPSWAILRPALAARERAFSIRNSTGGNLALADRIEAEAWARYVPAYTAEMRQGYRANRERWDTLLGQQESTLCCYCTDAEHCHRRLLASMLVKCGAIYMGER